MRVINIRHGSSAEFYDKPETGYVYVGRPSPLGNPFSHLDLPNTIRRADLVEAVESYREWLWGKIKSQDSAVMTALGALTEKSILGCWCKPKLCHGDVIVKAWTWLQSQGRFAQPLAASP